MVLFAAMQWLIRQRWACILSLVTVAVACPHSAWTQPALSTGALADAQQMDEQGVKLREAGRLREAQPLAEQALAIREKALGPEHLEVAKSLHNLANIHLFQGEYAAAEPLYRRAAAIRTKFLGAEHLEVTKSLNNLAALYIRQSRYVEAEPLFTRVLAVQEKILGPEHALVGMTLDNLAVVYSSQGHYTTAERLHRRALRTLEKALGPEHPSVARTLDNLAIVYSDLGDYAAAEPLYRRALQVSEKALGSEHPDVATTLNNLAVLHTERGDFMGAEPLHRRALQISEKLLGPEHPDVALSLHNLAGVYEDRREFTAAEPLYRRALAIREKVLGPEHSDVAAPLSGLGVLYWLQGDYDRAEPLYRRALAIREKALGPEHPDVASGLVRLANMHRDRGEYAVAELLYQRALGSLEKTLGSQHPKVAATLFELALLRLGQGRTDDVPAALQQVRDIQERNLGLNLPATSEQNRYAYLSLVKDSIDLSLWLHLHRLPGNPQAARLALSAALGRKGRVLEEATLTLTRLRNRLPTEEQQPLQQLADVRAQLARLVLKGPAELTPEKYQAQISALRTRARRLEDDLAEAGARLRDLSRPLTLQAVQQALPQDAVLVEFVLYRPFDPRARTPAQRFGVPRYAAYLLPPQGDPWGIDLGEARQVDALIRFWHSWLLDPGAPADGRVFKLARQLHQKLLAPLGFLRGVQHLLIAPDGQLNTLPFAALVGADGRSVLQKYTLTYLVSGRELPLLSQAAPIPRSRPLVLGGPDFARALPSPAPTAPSSVVAQKIRNISETQTRATENLHSPALNGFTVRPLAGALAEATAIAQLLGLPSTQLLTGARATENALKAIRSPAMLHLATHGFFLADQDGLQPQTGFQEPLLRSGVALAGFNTRSSGAEDGVLTALEVQGLDLEGTQLAVLSACQSAAGPIVSGEGVQGLRRALALAGTRSQVLALWPVEDRTTAGLMEQFYRKLTAKLGRSEALRQAQLAVARQPGHSHPYWWAAFVLSGDWRTVRLTER